MSTIKIPQNGLPQALTNIPFGHILILINPSVGILSKNVLLMQFIYSMARDYGHQSYIINSLPVDCPELWDCAICKTKSKEGIQILISDMATIVEMLCEFWGLDYDEVTKGYVVADRYKKYVSINGDSHPVRIPVPATRKPKREEIEVGSTILQCTQVYTKERQLAKIESSLEEGFTHNIDITFSDIVSLLERVKARERKSYKLFIKIEKGEENEGKNGVWDSRRTCDIWLVDSTGKEHPFDLIAQLKALYLTFILFNNGDGIKLSDIKTNDEFYNIFKYICERLRSVNNIPDKEGLEKEVRGKRSKIKKVISNSTNGDINAMELFGIEGDAGDVYKVAGATNEHRDYIKEKFGIE